MLALLALAFFVADYLFFKRIIDYLISLPYTVAEILIPQFLMVICLMFFSMLVFSNIIASISTFYLSRDLDLLMSAPLKTREIFSSRFLVTMVNSSWMLFIFGIPIFVALGVSNGALAGYYLGVLLTLVPFIAVPAASGIFITVLLMRYFPAKKTHQFLTIIGLIFMAGIVMFFRFLKPEKFFGKEVPMEIIQQYVESLEVPDYWFLPSTWAARAFDAGTKGNFSDMSFWIALAWGMGILLVFLNIHFVSRMYYRGWSIAYAGRGESRFQPRKGIYKRMERLFGFIPSPLRAVVLKDVRQFWRDPSQWTQLFMLGALVVIYIFNIKNIPMQSVFLKNFISVMNIGLAGVVLAAIAARFVFITTSVEGKSFWLIKSSPVDFGGYLWVKFFFYLIPLLFFAELLVVTSNLFLAVDRYLMAISIGGIFFITIGLTGLGIGLGAKYPVFEHENIAELATSTGAIYYMLVSLVYIGLVIMFGIRPVWVYFSEKFLSRDVGGLEVYVCYAVVLILTALVTVIPMRAGAKALKGMEF